MIITPKQYPHYFLTDIKSQKRKSGNQRTKIRRKYKDVLITFDIETTRLTGEQHDAFAGEEGRNEQAIVYLWAMHFHQHFTIIGRTLDELKYLLHEMRKDLAEDWAAIYVHNLSYEFQFLRGVYDFGEDEVFALDSRKVLRCDMFGKLEFRCSYLHSNMSLAEYTTKMQVEHRKLSGEEFDYKKTRYPWTPITEKEMQYMIHDVIGLAEALEVEMQADGDNLYTIPMTSTGYVRRDAKKALQKAAHIWIKDILPDYEVFQMLREAFRGGDTHANRYYSGRVLHNVKSADRSSSYPDVQCNNMFPRGSWHREKNPDLEWVLYLLNVRRKAAVMRISISNLALRNIYDGAPYISKDKCRRVINGSFDNGRVLDAEYLECTVTDIDLKIIMEQYKGEVSIYDIAYTRYGYLPEELRKVDLSYYKAKTELKGVDGQEVYYIKSKNKLNSVYGMSAQNPAKPGIKFINGEWKTEDIPEMEILAESYKHAFMSYAWGVWTTAWARWHLREGIKLAGDNFVYCDTDSVKYLGDIDWSEYNNARIEASTKSGAYATDPAGNTHYMGVFEMEKEYCTFATLGAKKYAFTYEPNGKTYVTIAGVTKSKGGAELDKGDEYGKGLERFCLLDPPFTFREAGGTEAMYNDNPTIGEVVIDGHTLEITPNVVLRDSTYTLGITAEYDELLKSSILPLDKWIHQC